MIDHKGTFLRQASLRIIGEAEMSVNERKDLYPTVQPWSVPSLMLTAAIYSYAKNITNGDFEAACKKVIEDTLRGSENNFVPPVKD
jgi:hypothetical protein